MSLPVKIAPSLLSADFSNLAGEIRKVEEAGCDLIHVDVMDGHFVPNLTIGPVVVKSIRRVTKLPLDCHLMIEHPERYIGPFADAGADHITVHAEACGNKLGEVLAAIRARGVRAGVSVKPDTGLAAILPHLAALDMILIMTVNPGFGGQAFMPEALAKVTELRKKYAGDIEVDGGINRDTARQAVAAGANVLVAGTAIFGKPDAKQAIQDLRCPA